MDNSYSKIISEAQGRAPYGRDANTNDYMSAIGNILDAHEKRIAELEKELSKLKYAGSDAA